MEVPDYEYIVDQFGNRFWKLDGEYHREDGPAVIWGDGRVEYYWRGKLHREDGPAVIKPNDYEEWWFRDRRHRIEGPAVTFVNGGEEWWVNGLTHRNDGPAVTYDNGNIEWYIDNIRIFDSEQFRRRSGLSDEAMTILILKYGEWCNGQF